MTYIYQTMSTSDIAHALRDDSNANWSLNGAFALAEHLENLAEETGQPIEFEYVALRCDYSEYASLDAFNEETGENETGSPYESIDGLRDSAGIVLEFEGGIIVADF